jgi:hypothetical protein
MIFFTWKWLHIAFKHGFIALGTFGSSLKQMCYLSITLENGFVALGNGLAAKCLGTLVPYGSSLP